VSRREDNKIAATLEESLSEEAINALGKATGQSQRLRSVTPYRLLVTLLGALGEGTTETIAASCRRPSPRRRRPWAGRRPHNPHRARARNRAEAFAAPSDARRAHYPWRSA